jgi:fumarate reductase subunit D
MQRKKIFVVKFIHSFIFLFMVACLAYILYCAIARRYDWTLLIALIAIACEGLVLLVNHGQCPFTGLARKYGDPNGSVTDILLPMWCARHTFKISMVVVVIDVIWLAWGYFG